MPNRFPGLSDLLRLIGALAAVLAALAAFWFATRPPAPESGPATLPDTGDTTGFARAFEPRAFVFPQDHGPHTDFQTEWWYYTGNLTTAAGDHAAYQLTFFRRGLSPDQPQRESPLASNQVYFAHFALTDVAGGDHQSFERFSRGAAGLAGANGAPFAVWLEDWRAEALDEDGQIIHLTAQQNGLALDLTLTASKPIVAHGDLGLSPKSDTPGNASYYLSFTRLATEGSISLGGESTPVTGESWFDHEWSTSALGAGAIGWDWFSLQLSDGQELMYFQIRREDGTLESASGGTLIAPDGSTRLLPASDVQIEVLDTWRSPNSDAVYPARWRIVIPSAGLDLEAEPWLPDQEMQVSFVYWEGAVKLSGTGNGQAIGGNGFIELTGYSRSIAGQF
jgi:predicted secreted hydrolase